MKAKARFKDVEVEDLCAGMIELENGGILQVASSMVAKPGGRVTIELYGSKATAVYSGYELPDIKFKGAKIKMEKPPVGGIHAILASVEGFRQWIMENKPYITPVRQSLPVLSAIEAIYCSADTGKIQEINRLDI